MVLHLGDLEFIGFGIKKNETSYDVWAVDLKLSTPIICYHTIFRIDFSKNQETRLKSLNFFNYR